MRDVAHSRRSRASKRWVENSWSSQICCVQSRCRELSVPTRRVIIAPLKQWDAWANTWANAAFCKVVPTLLPSALSHFAMTRLAGGPFSPSSRIQDPKSLPTPPSPVSLVLDAQLCLWHWLTGAPKLFWGVAALRLWPLTAEVSCSSTLDPAESPELKTL